MKFMRAIYILILSILSSCSSEKNTTVLVSNIGETQGTYFQIKYLSHNGTNLGIEIDSVLNLIDNSLSTYIPNSVISKINFRQDIIVDSLFSVVFKCAKTVYEQTQGALDCSIAPLTNAWGFGFESKEDLDSNKVNMMLKNIGFNKVKLKNDSIYLPKNMMLEFNALAQGFTVDLIAEMFNNKKISNYLIEIGGEIKAKGLNADKEIWKVGVDKPLEKINEYDRFQFILNLKDKSIATSGDYRKFFIENGVKYSHTIDPFTGFPSRNSLLSVSVVHDDCMLADAYATAFMVMGKYKTKQFLENHPEIEAYIIYSENNGAFKTFISSNLKRRIVNH